MQSGTDQILPEIRGRPCSARPRWISKDMKEGADVSLEERVEVGWNSTLAWQSPRAGRGYRDLGKTIVLPESPGAVGDKARKRA